jgi:hypothetical protein
MTGRTINEGLDSPVVNHLGLSFVNTVDAKAAEDVGDRGVVFVPTPVKVCDFFEGPDALLGLSMTFETKTHTKWFGVINLVHFIDLTVAFNAGKTSVDVNRMVKIDIIRHFVHLHPRDGLTRFETFPHQS